MAFLLAKSKVAQESLGKTQGMSFLVSLLTKVTSVQSWELHPDDLV
jgi:hypothetical protein